MICQKCSDREGDLVHIRTIPINIPLGITEPRIFRYYWCKQCRSKWNKNLPEDFKYRKLAVISET